MTNDNDKNQELAQAVESVLEHFVGMRDAMQEVERLSKELDITDFLDYDIVSLNTELMIMAGDVVGLKSNVVAYFSNRAGGRG